MDWRLAATFGWTFEEIDRLSPARLQEYAAIIDGKIKAGADITRW